MGLAIVLMRWDKCSCMKHWRIKLHLFQRIDAALILPLLIDNHCKSKKLTFYSFNVILNELSNVRGAWTTFFYDLFYAHSSLRSLETGSLATAATSFSRQKSSQSSFTGELSFWAQKDSHSFFHLFCYDRKYHINYLFLKVPPDLFSFIYLHL